MRPGTLIQAKGAVIPRPHSFYTSDAASGRKRNEFALPLILDCKGSSSSQLDCCIANHVRNAGIELAVAGYDLWEIERERKPYFALCAKM